MYNCPTCNISLKKSSSPFGLIWSCPTCSGKAISVHVLRKAVPQNIINKLWQRAKSGQYKSYRKCPICQKDLPEIPIIHENKIINLDICVNCWFVWFDGHEYESLPKQNITKKELSPEAKKALAMFQVQLEQGSFGNSKEDMILNVGELAFELGLQLIFRMFI